MFRAWGVQVILMLGRLYYLCLCILSWAYSPVFLLSFPWASNAFTYNPALATVQLISGTSNWLTSSPPVCGVTFHLILKLPSCHQVLVLLICILSQITCKALFMSSLAWSWSFLRHIILSLSPLLSIVLARIARHLGELSVFYPTPLLMLQCFTHLFVLVPGFLLDTFINQNLLFTSMSWVCEEGTSRWRQTVGSLTSPFCKGLTLRTLFGFCPTEVVSNTV